MQQTPVVSIIIPHFNRVQMLSQTLASVLAQTYTGWEVIIVDDGSSAKEWAALQKFRSGKIQVLQRNEGYRGPSTCRNIGVKNAKGDYLVFLDSDDLLAPFCLEQRILEMTKNHQAGLCVFLMEEFINSPGDIGKTYNNIVAVADLAGAFLQNKNPWNVTCPIWRKSCFEKLRGFDEDLLFMEDPELHLRVLCAGVNFKICYEYPADCYYRINNIDETKEAFWYNSIYYRIQFYRKLTKKAELQKLNMNNRSDIKRGVYQMVKTFLYARKNNFPELCVALGEWMTESRLFSKLELARLRILLNIGNSNSNLLKNLRVKGICFRLLPTK